MKPHFTAACALPIATLAVLLFARPSADEGVHLSGMAAATVAAVASPQAPGIGMDAEAIALLEARAKTAVVALRNTSDVTAKLQGARRVLALAASCEKAGSQRGRELRLAASQALRAAAIAQARRSEPDWSAAAELLESAATLDGDERVTAALQRCELEAWARSRYKAAFAIVAKGKPGTFAEARSLLGDVPEDCDVGPAARVLMEQASSLDALDRARDAMKRKDRKAAARAAREALANAELPGYASTEAREILRRSVPPQERAALMTMEATLAAPEPTRLATTRPRAEAFARSIQ